MSRRITDLLSNEVSLPHPLTSLIGREREVEEVAGLLRRDDVRLVTLTGPGGVGKTRLAIATALAVSDAFPDGVVFISLASLTDPGAVLPAIGRSLGIHDRGEMPLIDQFASSLRNRQVLLVLDNFEHVSEAAPELAAILSACPSVSMVVTSRIRLRLSGEWGYEVGPLALPDAAGTSSVESNGRAASVELFAHRASAADSRFSLTEANLPAVMKICRRLGGLPLAIELAAARVKFLPPLAMLDHLDSSLPVLRGGGSDMPARHRTMSDAIRWSFELLDPNEQLLFARLAVFSDGFTISAADAVCTAAGGITSETVSAGIESLVEHSLVRPIESGSTEPRFGMLEPVRDFARELLDATGELDPIRDAHAWFYMDTVDHDMPPFGARVPEWVEDVKREEGNFIAALDWAVSSGNAELAMRLGQALVFLLWSPMVRFREQQFWLSRVLELAAPGLEAMRASIYGALAWAELSLGDLTTAGKAAEKTFALAMASGNTAEAAWALNIKGIIEIERRDYDAALKSLEPALEIARSDTDLLLLTSVLNRLCGVSTMKQDFDRAMAFVDESMAITRSAGDPIALVDAQETLVFLLRRRGHYQAAAALGREFLAASSDLGSEQYLVFALESVVRYAVALGRHDQAARLLGAASRFEQKGGVAGLRVDEAEYQTDLRSIRDSLTAAEYATAWTAGVTMPVAQAVAEADQVIADWGEFAASLPDDARTPFGLTARELEVLRLVAAGRSNRDIAGALYISVPTVKVHVRSIMTKLELESRTAAAAFAIRNNLA